MNNRLSTLITMAILLAATLTKANAQTTFEMPQPSVSHRNPTADIFYKCIITHSGTSYILIIKRLSPQEFAGSSSINFGTTTQTGSIGLGSYIDIEDNFTLDLAVPILGETHPIDVVDDVNGTTSYDGIKGATDAVFAVMIFKVDKVDDGMTQTLTEVTDPDGRRIYEVSGWDHGSDTTADLFLNQTEARTAPGNSASLSFGDYVQPMPKPSNRILLIGIGLFSMSILLNQVLRRPRDLD